MSAGEKLAPDSEGLSRLSGALARLDPFSFFLVPAEPSSTGDFVVAGTTGVFLIAAYTRSGVLTIERGKPRVDGTVIPSLRELTRDAKRLRARMSAASVHADVEAVVCLTHAHAGAPRDAKGVRIVAVADLARDISGRPTVQAAVRAQRAARVLGMQIAGDQRRHFVP